MNNFDIIAPLTNNSGGRPDTRLIEFSNSPTYKNINSFASKLAESKPRIEPIDFVYGHCMMIKREVFLKIGLLDERFGVGNYDDVDFCRRATEAGFKIGLCRHLFVYHFCHSTFSELGLDVDKIISDNLERYMAKWEKK